MTLIVQKIHTAAFRRAAVELVRSTGRTIREVADELGISYVSLRAWRKQEQLDLDERDDRLTSDESGSAALAPPGEA